MLHRGKGSGRLFARLAAASALLIMAAVAAPRSQTVPGGKAPIKEVVFLFTEQASRPLNAVSERAVRQAMDGDATLQVQFHYEFLDIRRHPQETYVRSITGFLRDKYAGRQPDLVIPVGPGSLAYAVRYALDIFPAVPMVYCNVLDTEVRLLPPGAPVAGTTLQFDTRRTVEAALAMRPGLHRVVLVSGSSDLDHAIVLLVKGGWSEPKEGPVLEEWVGLPMDDLLTRLNGLGNDSVVLFSGMYKDGTGQEFTNSEALEPICAASSVPVFSYSSTDMDHGIVGGYLYNVAGGGARAGEAALRILHGAAPAKISVSRVGLVAPVFDARQLRRFGIRESDLPKESEILFQRPSFWRGHVWLMSGIALFVAVETLLLVALATERYLHARAEARVVEDEQRLNLATASAKLGIWEWRADRKAVWGSPEARALYGLEGAEEVSFAEVDRRIHPEDLEAQVQVRERALLEPGDYQSEYRLRLPDGSVRWLAARAKSFAGPSGKVERLLGVSMDITERKEAEERLRASEQRYRAFVSMSTEGVCRYETEEPVPTSLDEDEQVERMYRSAYLAECNDAFARMFGRSSAAEMTGLRLGDTLPRNDPRNLDYLRMFIRSGYRLWDSESYKTDMDGNVLCISNSAAGEIRDGSLVRVWSIQRDITQRKRLEESVRMAADEWKATFDSIQDMVMILDTRFRIQRLNASAAAFFGLPAEELVGKQCHAMMHGTDEPPQACPFENALRTRSHQEVELWDATRRVWHRVTVDPILDGGGRVTGVVHTVSDISDRKQAEQALRESEQRYRSLFERSPIGIYRTTPEGRILAANPALVQKLAYGSLEEMCARNLEAEGYEPGYARGEFKDRIERDGEVRGFQSSWLTKDGRVLHVRENATVIRDDDGGVLYYEGTAEDVTAQHDAEQALQESERRYRELFESAIDGIAVADADTGVVEECNPALLAMVGRSREEVVGHPQAVLHPDQPLVAGVTPNFALRREHPGLGSLENKLQHKDGRLLDVEIRARLLRLNGRRMLLGMFRDITGRKQAEEALRKSDERLRLFFHHQHVGMAITSLSARWLEVNEALCRMVGYSREELLSRTWIDLTHPDDVARDKERFQRLISGAVESYTLEKRYVHKDGHTIPVFLSVGCLRDEYGNVDQIYSIMEDLTERRRVLEALQDSEEQYRQLFDHMLSGLMVVEVLFDGAGRAYDHRFVRGNPAFEAMTGLRVDDLVGTTSKDLPVRWPPKVLERLYRVATSGEPIAYEWRDEPPGRTFETLVFSPRHGQFALVFTDVTERNRAEEARRQSEALTGAIFESLMANVAVLDRAGRIIAVNERWLRFAEEGGGDLSKVGVGVNYLDVCRRSDEQGALGAAEALEGIGTVLDGIRKDFIMDYQCPAPEHDQWFEMVVHPLRRAEGGAIVTHTSITARREAETEAQGLRQELSHVTRVAVMGELTAALAHELNQPLTAIRSNAQAGQQLLARGELSSAETGEILADIVADDQRASEIIRRLRAMLVKGRSETQELDVNETIQEVAALVRPEAVLRDVFLTLDLTPGLPQVQGDRVQMQQVVLNLIANGMDAVKGQRSRWVSVRTWAHGDGEVRIAIGDSGTGVPEGEMERIFEPFVTTKSEGMGMGLTICRSIVSAHGGRLWCENNEGGGATFKLALPARGEDA